MAEPQIRCFYQLFWKNGLWGDTDLWLTQKVPAQGRGWELRVTGGGTCGGGGASGCHLCQAGAGCARTWCPWVLGTCWVSQEPARSGFGTG